MNSGLEMREGSKVKISELVDMEDVCGRVPGLDLLCKEPLFGKSSAFTGLCHSGDAFIHVLCIHGTKRIGQSVISRRTIQVNQNEWNYLETFLQKLKCSESRRKVQCCIAFTKVNGMSSFNQEAAY